MMTLKIYFAHSVNDFNTLREAWALSLIKEFYPGVEIVNPAKLAGGRKTKLISKVCIDGKKRKYYVTDMDYYLKKVCECDIFIYTRRKCNGFISQGVRKELSVAKENHKRIYLLANDGVFIDG